MKLNKLSLKDKETFVKYLGLCEHKLSAYTFENIYIWKGIFDIYWTLIKDCLCVFFKDNLGCFLYIPPQGKRVKSEVCFEIFEIMNNFNKNKDISRIENVEQRELAFYQDLGYACIEKYPEYLHSRIDLVQLGGKKFKSQRAAFNYFIKHYKFEYLLFSARYKDDCLKLYNSWMEERKVHHQGSIYQRMLKDTQFCLKILLDNFSDLDFRGRIVKIEDEIKAFTFGFNLNKETFCILYEITDLSIKGLAQFIFRQFCGELTHYRYINIMDDSGLENLKRVKLSYHPLKLIPAYIVSRKNGEKFR